MLRAICLTLACAATCQSRMIHKFDRPVQPQPEPAKEPFTLVNTYRRSEHGFTEGLSFVNGHLLESTGNYGETKLQYLRLDEESKTVVPLRSLPFDESYFGEGSSLIQVGSEMKVFMMTYVQGVAVQVDSSLSTVEKVFRLPSKIREGWGMTVLPDKPATLLVSDGSATLFECDAANEMKVLAAHEIADPTDPNAVYQTLLAADALRYLTLQVTASKASGHPGGFASSRCRGGRRRAGGRAGSRAAG